MLWGNMDVIGIMWETILSSSIDSRFHSAHRRPQELRATIKCCIIPILPSSPISMPWHVEPSLEWDISVTMWWSWNWFIGLLSLLAWFIGWQSRDHVFPLGCTGSSMQCSHCWKPCYETLTLEDHQEVLQANNNLIAKPCGMDGCDPSVKYDYILFKCLLHPPMVSPSWRLPSSILREWINFSGMVLAKNDLGVDLLPPISNIALVMDIPTWRKISSRW